MVPNKFIRKSAICFRLSLVLTFLSYFRFYLPAIKPEVEVGDIWFLICSYKIDYELSFEPSFEELPVFNRFFADKTGS